MKALTICQPYADMIATGEKIIENRTWPTSYRGRLAIHAGKSRDWLIDGDDTEHLAFGAVVATAELIDCIRFEHLPPLLAERQDANGPWCWVLQNVKVITPPVPARGAQGLWEWREEPRR